MRIIQPEGWQEPVGYSNGVQARGDIIFVAGQVGWDATGNMVGDDLATQARQALNNVLAVVRAGGGEAGDIVRMTWYVTDLDEYKLHRREIGQAYRELMGYHYPAMSLVMVAGLLEDGARVEIEATAVIDRDDKRA